MALELLLRYHHGTGEGAALEMATRTLEAMARGGIYDQLGGGFHRYSVDDHWLVPHFEKMLYDNALLARVYLHAWQMTGHALFRSVAEEVLDYVIREMTDPQGGFYDTPSDHEELIVRPRHLQDNATPSGNGMAAYVLQRLAGLAGEPRYKELAGESLRPLQPLMARYPLGFAQWLVAQEYFLSHPREVAIVGAAEAADTQALLAVTQGYRPHQVVALGTAGAQPPVVPLLQGRGAREGRATAYVCTDSTCQAPVGEPQDLRALLL